MSVTTSQLRLGMAVTWYLALVIAVVTLVPFEFQAPSSFRLVWFTTASDLIANVAFFVPFGFFVAFAHRGRPLLAGVALSVLVEFLQQFLPGRSPSALDVATNAIGAGLGGAIHRALVAGIGRRQRDAGVAALDLPLMGSVYLSVPLLWLSGLAAGNDGGRRWLVALLGVAVAIVLSSVSRHHLAPRGHPPARTALLGGAGMALGLLPGWYDDPAFIATGAGLVVIGVLGLGDLIARIEPAGRRFEGPTIRRALVPFGCYLLLAALWPINGLGEPWHGLAGVSRSAHGLGQLGILRLLELMAAASVAGYAIAEVRGRAARTAEAARRGRLVASLSLGAALAVVRGFHEGYGASLVDAGLVAVAAWVGALLYQRQRAYVLDLLGIPEPAGGPASGPNYSRIAPPPLAEGAPKWR